MKSFAPAALLNPIVSPLAHRRVRRWDRRLQPDLLQEVQESILLSHLKEAADTRFGLEHRFSKIKNYKDFKSAVPLRSYLDFEPYIQRMRQGDHSVLWPGLIKYWGQSSGTSHTAAKNKFLPISDQQIKWQQKAAFDVMARYLALSKDKNLFGGFNLGLFPPSILNEDSPGIFTGSNPGIMFRNLPAIAKMAAIPKESVRDIEDYDQKYEQIAEKYADYDVRAISGTSCWFSIFFDKLLSHTGAETVSEVWPKLRVLFGGGVKAAPYRQLINQRVGKEIVLMDNYNATEGGLFSVTDSLEDPAMLMIPDRGVFFEFVNRKDHGLEDPKRFALWEVEPGIDYSVVLTTSSGLFAYYVGDFVRFDSIYPHRMNFVGRPSGVISLTQELVTYGEIEQAVLKAQEKVDCLPTEYCVAPEVGVDASSKGRYLFFFEFTREPSNMSEFIKTVDRELASLNRVYKEHRADDVAILSPAYRMLPFGSSKRIMKELGFKSVQNKFPRILDERKRDLVNQMLDKEHMS